MDISLQEVASTLLQKEVKLTNWANEPSLTSLKKDYELTRQYHNSHMTRVGKWLDNLHITGSAKIPARKGHSSVQPKLIRKQAEWRYPALTEPFVATTELFDVNPVSWEDRKSAQQNALILNNQFNTKIDKIAFFDDFVRTLVDEGTAIIRVGWKYEEGKVKEVQNQYQYIPAPEMLETYQQLIPQLQEDPTLFKAQVDEEIYLGLIASLQMGQAVRAVVTGTTTTMVNKVIANHPTVKVCDVRNVHIDPTCNGDVDNAQFVIHSYESSLSELKRDKRYKNLDRLEILTLGAGLDTEHAYTTGSDYATNFEDKARKRLIVYEYWGYWDIEGNGLTKPIVATWVGDTMIRLEENPFPDGKLPFVVATYMPRRKEVYGEPDGELLEDNQRIIGAVTRGMIDLLGKSANSQIGYSKQFLDATNKRKFENGENYEYNPNTDPRIATYMHTYPEIPNSAMYMVNAMNLDAESLTGVKAFSQGGITGEGLGETAAGVRGALDASAKREMSILRRASNAIIKVGRKFISMNAEFLSDEEIIRVTNEKFVKVKRDDLAGNYDLKLTISTAESDNAKAQELAFMLQTMGSMLPPKMTNLLLSEIARLRNMPDLAYTIETYEPEPDPMQEQLQQLQLQLLQAQVALVQAQAQEATTKAQLNNAKVPVEGARAENLASEANRKAVDTLNDQQGVTHQRELEKEYVKQSTIDQAQRTMNQLREQVSANQHRRELDKMNAKANIDNEKELVKAYTNNLFNTPTGL